jgi:uncharacterized membrane protein
VGLRPARDLGDRTGRARRRRAVLGHAVYSFFFNTAVLAVAISTLVA